MNAKHTVCRKIPKTKGQTNPVSCLFCCITVDNKKIKGKSYQENTGGNDQSSLEETKAVIDVKIDYNESHDNQRIDECLPIKDLVPILFLK